MPSMKKEVQSIIGSLHDALQKYSSILNETSELRDFEVEPCNESTQQISTVAVKLTYYQDCAEKIHCPDLITLCAVVRLNDALVQHLNGSLRDPPVCPSSSSTPPPTYSQFQESLHCVHCWSQEVAALRR